MKKIQALQDILNKNFSFAFIEHMKNRVIAGSYKYGDIADNVSSVDIIDTVKKRLNCYELDGNLEWLVDAANCIMFEFMYPSHENAHFRATSSDQSPGYKSRISGEYETIRPIDVKKNKKSKVAKWR